MITALDRSGLHGPRAVVKCDGCEHSQYEPCDYERVSGGNWRPNEGQIIHRLTKQGWHHVKGKLFCLACSVARKGKKQKEADVPKPTDDVRSPSREQKRQIVDYLTEVYDVAKERYKGCESDITVAEAIGGGCMFGWVADIREEMFGPDGRNEEVEFLADDMRQWQETASALSTEVHAALKKFDAERAKVADMARRLDAIIKVSGPRVRP